MLSENGNFGEVCEACHIKFIGPTPDVIRLMGEKEKARAAMKQHGVPILPGSDGVIASEEEAIEWARKVEFPVILKATAGGGGRGAAARADSEKILTALRPGAWVGSRGWLDDRPVSRA